MAALKSLERAVKAATTRVIAASLRNDARGERPDWRAREYRVLFLRHDRIGDTDIPPDSVVAISPYVLHRHPRYWPEPETFEPRRFMDENGERTRKPYSYIPFGAGPRSCIGANFALAEAPLIVGLLMQRYRMTLPDDVHVRPHGIFVLTPRPPIRASLTSIERD